MKPPRPYTRRSILDKLDRRSVAYRFMQAEKAGLIAHCGGNPSTVQLALIDQIAWLRLHLRTMTNKMMEAGGNLTELDSRTFLAWNNSAARALAQLGPAVTPEADKPPTLQTFLASQTAAKANAE